MSLLTTAFLALGIWALARFVVLELVKKSWQRAAGLRQVAKAGSLAAAEKLVQVSFTCAVTLLGLWILTVGIRALGAFTPENVWAAVRFLDFVAAASKSIGSGIPLVVLGLLVVAAVWYAWREGAEAIANQVMAHIASDLYARRFSLLDGRLPVDKPLSIEMILLPKRGDGRWARVASFVLSQGFISSAKVTGKFASRLGLIALCLSIVWVESGPLADLSTKTVNELIVSWGQKRTREELYSAAARSADKTPPAAESIEIANYIARDLIAAISRDPVFRFSQPPPTEVASLKRGLRIPMVRAAILATGTSSPSDEDLFARRRLFVPRSWEKGEDLLVESVVPVGSRKTKGEWLLAIPGVREVLPSVLEKFRAYRRSFAQPVSLGTLYDTVLDQVANHLWDLAPLETDSNTGKLARKIVDEFGEKLLKKYIETKFQQAIVRLATSDGPYDPATLAEAALAEERAVPRVSSGYLEDVDAATRPLLNAGQLAAKIQSAMRPSERSSSTGLQPPKAARYLAGSYLAPLDPPERYRAERRDPPPAEAFVRYDDLTDTKGQAKDEYALLTGLELSRQSRIFQERQAEKEAEFRDFGLGARGRDFRSTRPPPSRPRPAARKAIEASGDTRHPQWPVSGPEMSLRWSRSGASLTLHVKTAGDKPAEQLLGTFDSAIVHQALRFAADGRTLLVTIRSLTGGNQELRRILLHPSLEDSALGCTVARTDVSIANTLRQRFGPAPERQFAYIGLREEPNRTLPLTAGSTTGLQTSFRFVATRGAAAAPPVSGDERLVPSSEEVLGKIRGDVPRRDLRLLAEFMVLQRFFRSMLYGSLSERMELEQLVSLARETGERRELRRTPKWDLQYVPERQVPVWLENDNDCGFGPRKSSIPASPAREGERLQNPAPDFRALRGMRESDSIREAIRETYRRLSRPPTTADED